MTMIAKKTAQRAFLAEKHSCLMLF